MVQNVLRNFTQVFGDEWMSLMCLFQPQRDCATPGAAVWALA